VIPQNKEPHRSSGSPAWKRRTGPRGAARGVPCRKPAMVNGRCDMQGGKAFASERASCAN